ncbi:MAG: hypothetical protein COU72_04075 [Parcubacteria group bacterium CG10_big_fil_rev_8_21_14_0_10_41_35]|nr:MAG: hypothetical protein COU72_04075 [Parcubacteria group bacterium CG10_big_fil_rev_8_21_14_0_10_41_35]
MPDPEFNFLKEKPLETIEEISNSKFGHEEIATTLEKITEKCPTPFTIGLFAKWGSGKSTIANSLKRKLLSKNIPVVLFDVWKHEGDALRRTFLKEIVKQLRSKDYGSAFLSEDFKLNDRLERSVSTSSDTKLKVNTTILKQLLPWFVGILVIVGIACGFLYKYQLLDNVWNFTKPFILMFSGVATGGAFLIWLLKQSVYFFSAETTSFGVDKFEDPHEFEEEFANILKALQHPRIVIVFDNLDRVTHDKVAEVLSTIKTFLEPGDIEDEKKEVVFLVPCDARSIKHHLANLYGSTDKFTFDSDEFLRKFFSTIVWIPDFIPVELESLAKDSLHETGVSVLDNNYVAWIITKAFRDNPRQIIQFVNILLANYLLVAERQGDYKDFPPDFLAENISQLTKYLILNQLFPDEIEVLRQKKVLSLYEVKTVNFEIKKDDISAKKKNAEFLKFIEETKNIPIENLRIFFTLRRSEQEKKFPGFESFITLLEDRKTKEAKEYLEKIGDFNDVQLVSDFAQAIKTEIENKTNPVSLANLVSTLFTVISENNIAMSGPLFQEISNILNGTCKEQIHLVSPKSVDNILFTLCASDRPSLITQWITAIEGMVANDGRYQTNRSFIDEVFGVLTTHPDYLDATQAPRIQQILTSNYSRDIELAQMVIKTDASQKKIGSPQYAQNFLGSLSGNQIPETVQRIDILNQFDDSLVHSLGADSVFGKFSEILTAENQLTTNPFSEKQKLVNAFNQFIQNHLVWMKAATEPVRTIFIDSLIAGYNVRPSFEEKSVFIPVLVEAKKYVPIAKLPQIESLLSTYLTNVKPESFNQSYSDLPIEEKTKFFEQGLYTPAETRSINDENFREEFFAKITDVQKQGFIEKLFRQNIEAAFQFVEKIDPKEHKNIFPIFDKIWTIYDSTSVQNKKRMFDFVNSRKADNDAHVREILADKISTCLTSVDLAIQEVGLHGLAEASKHLAQPRLRQIVKEVFDWIRKPEISPKYQPFSIRAILSENDQFNDQEKAEFVQFVFEELVRKSTDIIHINFGLEILGQLKPKYEDRTQNFDDIKLRIDSEQDINIKNALVTGLAKLKPFRVNTDNKDFWLSIDELVSPKEEKPS